MTDLDILKVLESALPLVREETCPALSMAVLRHRAIGANRIWWHVDNDPRLAALSDVLNRRVAGDEKRDAIRLAITRIEADLSPEDRAARAIAGIS